MEEKPVTKAEAIVGIIMYIILFGGIAWVMIACGGCTESGTRLPVCSGINSRK